MGRGRGSAESGYHALEIVIAQHIHLLKDGELRDGSWQKVETGAISHKKHTYPCTTTVKKWEKKREKRRVAGGRQLSMRIFRQELSEHQHTHTEICKTRLQRGEKENDGLCKTKTKT